MNYRHIKLHSKCRLHKKETPTTEWNDWLVKHNRFCAFCSSLARHIVRANFSCKQNWPLQTNVVTFAGKFFRSFQGLHLLHSCMSSFCALVDLPPIILLEISHSTGEICWCCHDWSMVSGSKVAMTFESNKWLWLLFKHLLIDTKNRGNLEKLDTNEWTRWIRGVGITIIP